MTRDVFDQEVVYSDFDNQQQWLNLWVPSNSDINRLFRLEYRAHLNQVSDTDFEFSGKKFKFLLDKGGR